MEAIGAFVAAILSAIIAFIALIITSINTHKALRLSNDAFSSSIRPFLEIRFVMANYPPPIQVPSDTLLTEDRKHQLRNIVVELSEIPYILLDNVGNGPAIKPSITFHVKNKKSEVLKLDSISKDNNYLIFLFLSEETARLAEYSSELNFEYHHFKEKIELDQIEIIEFTYLNINFEECPSFPKKNPFSKTIN